MILNFDTNLVFDDWPVFELYNENDEFICHVELIPDGRIGISNTPLGNKWCFLYNKICFLKDNKINIIFKFLDKKNNILKGVDFSNKKNFYLKFVIT